MQYIKVNFSFFWTDWRCDMYTWMDYPNADIWNHDTFETVQECIEDAKENYLMKQGETIYIGECQNVSIGGIDLEDTLCRVEEDMYEEVGEVSEGWDIYSTNGCYADNQFMISTMKSSDSL